MLDLRFSVLLFSSFKTCLTSINPKHIKIFSQKINNKVLNHTQPDSFTVEKESDKDEIPILKYQEQTPLNKPNNKRGCNVLSPAENALNDVDISQAIESGVQKAVASLIPTIVQSIRSELRSTINEIVDDKLKQMKEQLQLRNVFENRKLELIALSEAKVLENYNRRENIKTLDLPGNHQSGQRDSYQHTTAAVISLARRRLNVSVTENDISIAHRLPASNRTQNRPVKVKFSRRMAKIEVLKNKKHQSDVRIFEDITKKRLNFLRMLKSDERINSAKTREGTIFYEWRQDG